MCAFVPVNQSAFSFLYVIKTQLKVSQFKKRPVHLESINQYFVLYLEI